jgi:hypothetical protein
MQYMGAAGAQLVEALHYKPEGRGFDSRWCNFSTSFNTSFFSVIGSSGTNESDLLTATLNKQINNKQINKFKLC